jgi:hypothetical protein
LAQPMEKIKSKTTAYFIRIFNINLKLSGYKITIIFSGKKMFCSFFRTNLKRISISALRMRHRHTNNADSRTGNFL